MQIGIYTHRILTYAVQEDHIDKHVGTIQDFFVQVGHEPTYETIVNHF